MEVIERVAGNATTDFGAPDGIFALDASPLSPRDLTRCRRVLEACWTAFDHAVLAAEGVELKKGPRGGGRELEAIVSHVVGAEASYLRRLTGAGVAADDADAAPHANPCVLQYVRGSIGPGRVICRAMVRGAALCGRRRDSCDGPLGTRSITRGRSKTARPVTSGEGGPPRRGEFDSCSARPAGARS